MATLDRVNFNVYTCMLFLNTINDILYNNNI